MVRVTVNASDLQKGNPRNPIIVEDSAGRQHEGCSATLHGDVAVRYDPQGLPNGARVWIEAERAEVYDDQQRVRTYR